ncbi:MAG: hypothetical protein EPN56_02435 [Rhodanobacter sp.]|nr:MAG: hypothetical protein EPN78_05985 [Rhodanobacter sp.]TAM14652.1 MAG: hypothetical protein EPN66_02200 [Rhodanobacter sp.]TAM37444.1 MAG: hypothetical protein EPN56_02435 [Rhodanobacter sp.]
MNGFDQLFAGMTPAERDAPATRGDITQLAANLVRLNHQLKDRMTAFEQRMEVFEQQLAKEVRP